MKKRFPSILFSILFLCFSCVLSGCDAYTEETTEGSWAARLSPETQKAFVYSYVWDGTEEGLRVEAPEKIAGCKVERYGGFYGRGVPMQFWIDIPGSTLIEKSSLPEDAEITTLTFTLVIRKGITDIRLSSAMETEYYSVLNKDGTASYYEVRITPELDPENTKYAIYLDKLWEKDYDEKELENEVYGFYYE